MTKPRVLRAVGLAALLLMIAAGGACSSSEPQPIDPERGAGGGGGGGGAAGGGGDCTTDAGQPLAGASNIRGKTPLGDFAANRARAYGQCLWFQFVSSDASGCARQIITAATGLRVPPWFEGSRVPVAISILTGADRSPLVAAGTLTVEKVTEADPPVLTGTLVVSAPDWALQGTFDAPWSDLPCK